MFSKCRIVTVIKNTTLNVCVTSHTAGGGEASRHLPSGSTTRRSTFCADLNTRTHATVVSTSSVKKFTRTFAYAGDVFRHRTKQLHELSNVIFVPTVIIPRVRIEQVVAGCQLERLQHYAADKEDGIRSY